MWIVQKGSGVQNDPFVIRIAAVVFVGKVEEEVSSRSVRGREEWEVGGDWARVS